MARRNARGPKPQPYREPNEQQRRLAKLYVEDHKPFKQAALEAGYRENYPNHGPRAIQRKSPAINVAINEAVAQ